MKKKTAQYVQKMKERPRHEQKRHAGTIALAVTGVLFLMWLPIFAVSIQTGSYGSVAREDQADIQLLRNGVASVANGFKQGFNVLRGQANVYSSIEFQADGTPVDDDVIFGTPLEVAEPIEFNDE
jgi:hypothetical protein